MTFGFFELPGRLFVVRHVEYHSETEDTETVVWRGTNPRMLDHTITAQCDILNRTRTSPSDAAVIFGLLLGPSKGDGA